jgi:parvulin-like peptidyl-prolyl isomerase
MILKKLLWVGVCLTLFSHAKVVNAIALTVDDEIITTQEIAKIQKALHTTREQAIDLLIQDRLQNIAMKHIDVSQDEVDERIRKIAKLNHISVSKMQKIIQSSGASWKQYRQNMQKNMQKAKFFQETILPHIPTPSQTALEQFYKTHTNLFVIPSRITLKRYSASSQAKIEKFLKTKQTKGIRVKRVEKKVSTLNPELRKLFLGTPQGGYTKVLNTGSDYVVYKVLSKSGKYQLPFKESKEMVARQWKQAQQDQALKDYFAKMKTNTHIEILRK